MTIIGLMSGTSMDGVDIVCCNYYKKAKNYSFQLLHCETFPYTEKLLEKLKNVLQLSVVDVLRLDKELGRFYAEAINTFCQKYTIEKTNISCIASHGHTVHHQPNLGFTQQIGCGTTIAVLTGIKVVNDFRTKDVVLGGQGAPLVPIGDKLLFAKKAEAFLNLGGFSNITIVRKVLKETKIIAYDICVCNLILNQLANKLGLDFDKNGAEAKKGQIHQELLQRLNDLPYYNYNPPKSLGAEFVNDIIFPILNAYQISINDQLCTFVEHISMQISNQFRQENIRSVYVSGGGAKNTYLINQLQKKNKNMVIEIPEREVIDYKEAIIFGLLGFLYLQDRPNSIATVTGACREAVGGVLHKAN